MISVDNVKELFISKIDKRMMAKVASYEIMLLPVGTS